MKGEPCPVCENKAHLSAMDMTPELVAEMAAEEPVSDYAGDKLVAKRLEIGKILRDISDWQEVKIIEAEVCPDHVHMFVAIPPKLSVSKFMGILKGKSSLIIFQRWSNLKYKFGQRSFWCRGYYVDTVGKNEKKIAEYVRNQLQEDMMYDQISIKEYKDPFNGS